LSAEVGKGTALTAKSQMISKGIRGKGGRDVGEKGGVLRGEGNLQLTVGGKKKKHKG